MLFGITSFLGAFLLFQVQPLIAKYILPWYGGTPAVWTTCMLFFQAVLLAGYFYAHKALRPLPARRQVLLHASLLACAVAALIAQAIAWRAPILADAALNRGADQHPVLAILFVLALGVGLPGVALASTSPVIQHWHARAWPDRSPYKLYALSNIGSLFALLSYPFLFEPHLTLPEQAWLWSGLFILYAALCACCSCASAKRSTSALHTSAATTAPPKLHALLWIKLAACGCLALLAVTNLVCQEVAVVPFLWVVPLSLYLLSFIVCFEFERFASRRFWMFALAVLSLASAVTLFLGLDAPLLEQLLVYNATLFALCMVCHGDLVRLRPAPEHLTGFYLAIAAGGCAGGFFASVLAPLIFTGFWEFPLVLVGVWLLLMAVLILDPESCIYRGEKLVPAFLVPGALLALAFAVSPQIVPRLDLRIGPHGGEFYYAAALAAGFILVLGISRLPPTSAWHAARPRWTRLGYIGLLGTLLLVLLLHGLDYYDRVLASSRNFYGVLRVSVDPADRPEDITVALRHGAILHGLQFRVPYKRFIPTAYYTEQAGVGMACRLHPRRLAGEPMRIGVVGLGVGAIAAYGRTGDVVRFYEINPQVMRYARDTNFFTFVHDAQAKVDIVPGDARLSLERELREGNPGRYDVFVLDAFSSDAIPAHLLTREALAVYLQHLSEPGGILAFNVSNRHLDLRPVVGALAREFDLDTLFVEQESGGEPGVCNTSWILAARRGHLSIPHDGPNFYFNEDVRRVRLWTDEFSNLFEVLR